MPKAQHDAIQRKVNREHPDWPQDRKAAYVYTVMRRRGWKPHQQTER